MSKRDGVRKLFFAELDAGMYDQTIELVVPLYRLMHETLIQLLRNHFEDFQASITVLDIGSGTGAETIGVLEEFPNANVVAVDLCGPMHTQLRKNFLAHFGSQIRFEERCTVIEGDILGDECQPERLKALASGSDGYDVVISAFTIHHLTQSEKARVYRRIHEALVPGGLFLNGDLFSFQSNRLARQALKFDLDWIDSRFDAPEPEFASAKGVRLDQRTELRDRWKEHYTEHNITEPVESSIDAKGHAVGQASLLAESGFSEVAVPFRYWQVGILWAVK